MKLAAQLKECDFAQRFEVLLRELLGRVSSLKLVSLQREPAASAGQSARADWTARLRSGNRNWTLLVEENRLGQPREVRSALLRLERRLKNLPGSVPRHGVLLAPFISAESAKLCAEAGIGYADLAGNARLAFGQVFIETHGAGNPFREKRGTRSLFAPRAARVVRVLLQGPLRPWKVTELSGSARVSLGWVSAVRRQLLAREWAEEAPGGLRVTKPGALLEAWAQADEWEKRTQTREYSVLHADPLTLAEKLQPLLQEEQPVFTQWFAASLRHPHTTAAVVTAYVRKFPDESFLEENLPARRVPAHGGLRLVLPKEEGVWNPSQTVAGFKLVSDAQIYLDLIRAGLRGEEQAAELRKWPDFAGGWK